MGLFSDNERGFASQVCRGDREDRFEDLRDELVEALPVCLRCQGVSLWSVYNNLSVNITLAAYSQQIFCWDVPNVQKAGGIWILLF